MKIGWPGEEWGDMLAAMKKWVMVTIVVVAPILITAVMVSAMLLHRDDGPVYEGKTLRQWVMQAGAGTGDASITAAGARAEAVLQKASTNDWPFLVRWMRCDQSEARTKMSGELARIPVLPPLGSRSNREELAKAAADALVVGREAMYGARTELLAMAADAGAPETARRAEYVLLRWMLQMEDSGFVWAQELATNSTAHLRRLGILGVAQVANGPKSTEAEAATRLLARYAATDPDPDARIAAVGMMEHEQGCCMDLRAGALAAALADPVPSVRVRAGWGLMVLGPLARAALPALTNETLSADPKLRAYARWAIREIVGHETGSGAAR